MIVFHPQCKKSRVIVDVLEFSKVVRQHSSASLIGGMRLLLDFDWLLWLRLVFEVLIGVVLECRFSGSSVNHVFFLFVPALVAVDAVGRGDGVHRGALLRRVGRVRGMGQAAAGLSRVVVELHQAEDQV